MSVNPEDWDVDFAFPDFNNNNNTYIALIRMPT